MIDREIFLDKKKKKEKIKYFYFENILLQLRIEDMFCDPLSALLGIQAESGNWVELHRVESV